MNSIIRPFFYSRTHINFYQNTVGVFYLELEHLYQRILLSIFNDDSKFSVSLWADLLSYVEEVHTRVISQKSILGTISSIFTIDQFIDFVSRVETTPMIDFTSLLNKISLFFPQNSGEDMSADSCKLMNMSDPDLFRFKALFNQIHTTVQRISQLLTSAIWMTESHQDTILEDTTRKIKKDLLSTVCEFTRHNEDMFVSFYNPEDKNNLNNYFHEITAVSLRHLNNMTLQINRFQTIAEAIMSDLREGHS